MYEDFKSYTVKLGFIKFKFATLKAIKFMDEKS